MKDPKAELFALDQYQGYVKLEIDGTDEKDHRRGKFWHDLVESVLQDHQVAIDENLALVNEADSSLQKFEYTF